MVNNVFTRVTLVGNNKKINQLYFDYFTNEYEFVGNIIVDEFGRIEWHIIDAKYEENILNIAKYLYGKNTDMFLDFVSRDYDIERWNKAKIYVSQSGVVLNYVERPFYPSEKKKIKR